MKKYYLIMSAILLLFSVQTAYSLNLRFLKYSPIRSFTEQDWEMLRAAAREALNNRDVGEEVSWKNPESGNSGDMTIIKVSESNTKNCKILLINNRTRDLEGKGRYTFCKQEDGTWKADESNPN